MSTRVATILEIRDQFAREGLTVAVRSARAAYEAGRIDTMDVPEIFMALKNGSWRFLEQLGVRLDGSGASHTKSTG